MPGSLLGGQVKGVSIDLALVMAFGRPHAVGIGKIFRQRRRSRVLLSDGSNVVVEDEDTDAVITALDGYLGVG